MWTQAVILGVGMTAAMVTVALQSGTAGDLVSCQTLNDAGVWKDTPSASRHMVNVCWTAESLGVTRHSLELVQVLVHGMLTQLWAPLVSVGGLYRRLRKVSLQRCSVSKARTHVNIAAMVCMGCGL